MRGPNFTAPTRTCLPVKFLTKFSCRPGSRFLPFSAQRFKQKHRSAFQVPYAHKAVYALPCKIKKPPKWRFYILPGKGLEPLSPKGQWFLRPSCIPIPAPRRKSFVLRKSYIFILANFMLKRKCFLCIKNSIYFLTAFGVSGGGHKAQNAARFGPKPST